MDHIIEGIVWMLIIFVKMMIAMVVLIIIVAPIVVGTPFVLFWPKSNPEEPYLKMVGRRYLELLGATSLGLADGWFD